MISNCLSMAFLIKTCFKKNLVNCNLNSRKFKLSLLKAPKFNLKVFDGNRFQAYQNMVFFPFVWSKPPSPYVLALLKFQAEGPRRKTLVGYIIITASRHLPTATTKISQTWINNSIILFSMKLLIWICFFFFLFKNANFTGFIPKRNCDPRFMK